MSKIKIRFWRLWRRIRPRKDTRRCERPGCGHPASVHSTGVPEQRVFMCEVPGCPCPGWIYGEG